MRAPIFACRHFSLQSLLTAMGLRTLFFLAPHLARNPWSGMIDPPRGPFVFLPWACCTWALENPVNLPQSLGHSPLRVKPNSILQRVHHVGVCRLPISTPIPHSILNFKLFLIPHFESPPTRMPVFQSS